MSAAHAPAPAAVPRQLGGAGDPLGRSVVVGALAVGLATVLFAVTPLSGAVGFVLCSYATFASLQVVDTTRRHGRLAARDRLATILVGSAGMCTIVPLLLIVYYVVSQGLPGLGRAFFTEAMESVGPLDPPTVGGARHAIVGTLQQVGLAAMVATPLGVMTGVHLSESGGRLARLTRLLVDAMSGLPSIVAGLFIYTLWVLRLDRGYSGLAAALALAVLMVPTVARTAEEVLRLVPGGLREASLALGGPLWRTVTRVVVPAARSGLVTAVVLGVARIAGETAPLLMTAFGSDGVNMNPLEGQQSSLPLFAYQRVRNAVSTQVTRGWAGALVLILLVLTLFTLARAVGARKTKTRGA